MMARDEKPEAAVWQTIENPGNGELEAAVRIEEVVAVSRVYDASVDGGNAARCVLFLRGGHRVYVDAMTVEQMYRKIDPRVGVTHSLTVSPPAVPLTIPPTPKSKSVNDTGRDWFADPDRHA